MLRGCQWAGAGLSPSGQHRPQSKGLRGQNRGHSLAEQATWLDTRWAPSDAFWMKGQVFIVNIPYRGAAPAIAEALPGFESSAWFGLFGPARMDAALVQKISQAARQALLVPAVRRRIEAEGAQVVGSSAADFERFVAQDVLRWRDVVRYAGAKPE